MANSRKADPTGTLQRQSRRGILSPCSSTPGPLGTESQRQIRTIRSSFNPAFEKHFESEFQTISDSAPKLNATLLLPTPNPGAPILTDADYQNAATELGVEVAAIRAVAEVESSGSGFDRQGRPTILFEALHFHNHTHGRYDVLYPHLSQPNSDSARPYYGRGWDRWDQWDRMYEAMMLDVEAAWMAASWGAFQIMGFNHDGFDTVSDFVTAMFESQYQHLRAFMAFCRSKNLVAALKKKNWAAFAYSYNGEKYRENQYDTRLQAAYLKYKK
jgi:hypothetical protein